MKKFGAPALVRLSIAQGISFVVSIAITLAGADSHGDLPGALRMGWLMVAGWLWSLVFAIHCVWLMIKIRSWIALVYSALAVGFRLGYSFHAVHDIFLDYPWLWFPAEGFTFVILSYPASLRARGAFIVWNLGLFATQLLMLPG